MHLYRLKDASILRKLTFSLAQRPELFQMSLIIKAVFLVIPINLPHKKCCLKHISETADLYYREWWPYNTIIVVTIKAKRCETYSVVHSVCPCSQMDN